MIDRTAKAAMSLPDVQAEQAVGRMVAMFPAPLWPGEKEADYASLASQIISAAKPRDAIEEILVRDLIDLTWEILRLRRVKVGVLKTYVGVGVREVLGELDRQTYQLMDQNIAKDYVAGDVSARQKVEKKLSAADLNMDDVMARTIEEKLDSFEKIDRLLASSEARRNNALREIDRHRIALGEVTRRAVEEVEDAEFQDVTDTQVIKVQP